MQKSLVTGLFAGLLALLFMIGGCGGPPAFKDLVDQANKVQELSYNLVLTEEGQKPETAKVYIKGDNIRTETTDSAVKNMVFINNAAQKVSYIYDPKGKQAIKNTLDPKNKERYPNPKTILKDVDPATAKYVNSETVDDKTAYVFDITYKTGGGGRVWLWEKDGIPLKYDSTVDKKKASVEFKGVNLDAIDDSMFVLPVGTTELKF